MKVALALTVLLLASGCASINQGASTDPTPNDVSQSPDSWIGTRYLSSTPPPGIELQAGWLVGELEVSPNYWLAQAQQGERTMLWFQVGLGYEGNQTIFEVVDVADLPAIGESGGLVSTCELNESPDPEIMAIVHYTDTEYLTDIRQVWRANRTSRKIEPISNAGIRCYNPGWGV